MKDIINDEEIKKEIIGKAGFPLYVDYWEKYFSEMSGEQVKECMKIIFHFNSTFEVPRSDDALVRIVVNTVIDNVKRDAHKRIKQSKASRGNGKLGGRPKKKITQKNPKEPSPDTTQQFNEFWDKYNHKKSRPSASNAFAKALKSTSFDTIMSGVNRYVDSRGVEDTYWKHPATWLNQQCWSDKVTNTKETSKFAQYNHLLSK
jgi:hypothetical protein